MAWSSPNTLSGRQRKRNNTIRDTTRRGQYNKGQMLDREEKEGPELDPSQEGQEDDEGTQTRTSAPNRKG